MKTLPTFLFAVIFCVHPSAGQSFDTPNEPSAAHPFGKAHPDMIDELSAFAPMIGICDCKSLTRNPDQSWPEEGVDMIWKFKYIMDGKAIQDESWKADGASSGSIRQYIADSSAWAVTYFSTVSPSASPGVWMGGQVGGDVVLTMPQQSPNGFEGVSRLTFYDISEAGYKWIGEWISKDGSVVYPFWKIDCVKR